MGEMKGATTEPTFRDAMVVPANGTRWRLTGAESVMPVYASGHARNPRMQRKRNLAVRSRLLRRRLAPLPSICIQSEAIDPSPRFAPRLVQCGGVDKTRFRQGLPNPA
jgi:hypothetical protein